MARFAHGYKVEMSTDDTHSLKDIGYHDDIALQYDRVIVEPRWSAIDSLFRPVWRQLPQRRDAMLDLGTGTGHMLRRYARHFRRVVAVDHSTGMLEVARTTAQRTGLQGIELVAADAFQFLQAETRRFDWITCVGFLHHLQPAQLTRLFGMLRERLEANGRLLISEPIAVDAQEPALIEQWNRRYRLHPHAYSVAAQEPDEAPLDLDQLHAALASAGLTISAQGRGWEIFPRHRPERWIDRAAIRTLHAAFGASGPVYWACCKA